MSENDEQIEQIEISIQHAKKQLELMQSMQKLEGNDDFAKVFTEGYLHTEASRLVLMKADRNMQSVEDQTAIIKSIDAIGHFRQYILLIKQMGRIAEKAIQDDEATRDELLQN